MRPFARMKTIWKCRKEIILNVKIKIDFIAFQKEWRGRNAHNSTVAGCKFDPNKVNVGEGTYGTLNIHCWDNPSEHLSIGSYCSIADDVHFILGGEHPIHRITTYPYKSHILGIPTMEHTGTKGPIVIEDDVWICYGATILSGVKLGKGCVVAAKSIVSKDVPPYSIFINGQIKGRRFSENVINKLKDIDLGSISKISDVEMVEKVLDMDVSEDTINDLLMMLN